MNAYNEIFLLEAQRHCGEMFDFAVNQLGYPMESFFLRFLVSGYAQRFELGEVSVISGKSGYELACDVIHATTGDFPDTSQCIMQSDMKCEYWSGWSLAYYQWKTDYSFMDISDFAPINKIMALYPTLHEADILQFCDVLDGWKQDCSQTSKLKIRRQAWGLSQSQLARQCGIPVKTIQQYEQRRKNINNAQAKYVVNLAAALHCEPAQLLD